MNSIAVSKSRIGTTLFHDLIEYIWSFNYNWAANIIQKYTKKYITHKVKNIYNMVRFAHFNCGLGLGINNYKLFYNNKIIKNNDVLKTLNACKCCVRHQKNKPNNMQEWVETEFHNTQYTSCNCSCRHLARFICREIS